MKQVICGLWLLFILVNGASLFTASAFERRRGQFSDQTGYALLPAPYNLPGIGSGVAFVGTFNNIAGSYIDAFALLLTGDVEGSGLGVTDLHLIPETLILDLTTQKLTTVAANVYNERGMDTKPDDYNIVELKDLYFSGARLTLTFIERRFEIYGLGYSNTSTLDKIRDNEGELVIDAKGADPQTSKSWAAGALLDLTDDRQDPRFGLRTDVSQSRSPPQNDDSPDYFVEEHNVTAYIPIGDNNTWVFNYFRSDAIVVRKGETNREVIAAELGVDCDALSGTAQTECLNVIDDVVASRKFGSSSSLGGRSRLRSFPQGRYSGAHTAFYGTEFRWNLTDESTPFDLYFIKDIRTGTQLAFFYEEGSIADQKDEVWEEKRSSTGIGFRLVTGSGLVYRIDYATGEEGGALTAIVNYPWESF